MKIEVSIDIAAPPDVVWPVMIDVERWPEWTASVTKVERLEKTPFGLGASARIQQPKLMTMIWRVSEFQAGQFFVWQTRSPGVVSSGSHIVRPNGSGSILTLAVEQKGWLVPIIGPLFAGLTRRYVEIEAQGLKKRCEE
jgi:uncharacterized membrane protein